ncbi:tryptophan--tRNA ligase [Candidatus Parcubacteria bacterium]|jgi:tryptophanyl-tRNA synthetase|nr:MAG: tryptophan--tRNA ligase [Candidatus Parcubacteria bacterium]
MKPVLVSGIQPTGKLHLGNYLGALKNFVELQNSGEYDCLFFIADLHSLTETYTPKEKKEQISDLFLTYLAVGLDQKKSVLFQQSAIAEHTELSWILNTITPFGELRRMTQFKDKSENESENTNVGLFDYPVLMAADILLYNASVVPVGDDQLQHLELTRTLARKFNSKFGKIFFEPKPLLTSVPRLMSLDDPEKKMSKSRPEGCLFIDDEPNIIRKKIQRAVTDSESTIEYNPKKRPGISNLVLIYSAITDMTPKEIVLMYNGKGYADFKKDLGNKLVELFTPFQEKKKELKKLDIKKILDEGNMQAKNRAQKTYEIIKKKVGLI